MTTNTNGVVNAAAAVAILNSELSATKMLQFAEAGNVPDSGTFSPAQYLGILRAAAQREADAKAANAKNRQRKPATNLRPAATEDIGVTRKFFTRDTPNMKMIAFTAENVVTFDAYDGVALIRVNHPTLGHRDIRADTVYGWYVDKDADN